MLIIGLAVLVARKSETYFPLWLFCIKNEPCASRFALSVQSYDGKVIHSILDLDLDNI